MELTMEQQTALRFVTEATHSRRRAVLQGYAGVGKTTVTSAYVGDLLRRGLETIVAAPTHKALDILRGKIGDGPRYLTCASLLGEVPAGNGEVEQRGQRKDGEAEVVVVDEASMINRRTLDKLLESPARVLLVGDPAQLPPVKETESAAFNLPNVPSFLMETIVRQSGGNPIIDLSQCIRRRIDDAELFLLDDLKRVGGAFEFVSYDTLRAYAIHALRNGIKAPILAHTNAQVDAHNRAIHSYLHPGVPLFAEGELAFVSETVFGGTEPILKNGDYHIVERCTFAGELEGVPVYDVWLEGHAEAFSVMGDWTLWDQTLAQFKKQIRRAREQQANSGQRARAKEALHYRLSAAGITHGPEYVEAMQAIDREYEAEESHIRQLVSRSATLKTLTQLRHSYAFTVHKSQGSTFDAALVDFSDIARVGALEGQRSFKRMLYTAVTRPSHWLVFGVTDKSLPRA